MAVVIESYTDNKSTVSVHCSPMPMQMKLGRREVSKENVQVCVVAEVHPKLRIRGCLLLCSLSPVMRNSCKGHLLLR